jgi:hypothetical protein
MRKQLGREDSNLRMQVPKTCVLPLDDAPYTTHPSWDIGAKAQRGKHPRYFLAAHARPLGQGWHCITPWMTYPHIPRLVL